jgi:hypothetical protein
VPQTLDHTPLRLAWKLRELALDFLNWGSCHRLGVTLSAVRRASGLRDVPKNGLGDHVDMVAAIVVSVNAAVQAFRWSETRAFAWWAIGRVPQSSPRRVGW